MLSLITRSSAVTRSRDSCVSFTFEPTTGIWNGVIFIRAQQGVFFLDAPFGPERPEMNTVYLNALFMRGRYSKRPYQLGEPVDDSLDHCILALFHDLCAAYDIKAHGLAQLAYRDGHLFSAADFAEIVTQARWENYVSPNDWDATAIMMLYKALDDAGYSPLHSVMRSVLNLPAP